MRAIKNQRVLSAIPETEIKALAFYSSGFLWPGTAIDLHHPLTRQPQRPWNAVPRRKAKPGQASPVSPISKHILRPSHPKSETLEILRQFWQLASIACEHSALCLFEFWSLSQCFSIFLNSLKSWHERNPRNLDLFNKKLEDAGSLRTQTTLFQPRCWHFNQCSNCHEETPLTPSPSPKCQGHRSCTVLTSTLDASIAWI